MFTDTIMGILKFSAGILICNAIGALSAFFSGMFNQNALIAGTWYGNLSKPGFWPPNAVFGPVWFFLYTLMGIGGTLISLSHGFHSIAFTIFCVQLLFNFIWSIVFFEAKSITSALAILITLDAIYLGMLIFIALFAGNPSDSLLTPELISLASYISCGTASLLPIAFYPQIQQMINNIYTNWNSSTVQNIISTAVITTSFVVTIAFLLFKVANIPTHLSGLTNANYAIVAILAPTMLWILFATYLNVAIKVKNPAS